MDLYREHILDHYKHPQNAGSISNPDRQAHGANPLCGDAVTITLKLQGEKIADVKFQGEGCAISQAAASLLTDAIKGKGVPDVQKMGKQEMLALLNVELSPSRLKCGLLALETVQKALKQ